MGWAERANKTIRDGKPFRVQSDKAKKDKETEEKLKEKLFRKTK